MEETRATEEEIAAGIEALVVELLASRDSSLDGILTSLERLLAFRRSCLCEWPSDGPVTVLAASGKAPRDRVCDSLLQTDLSSYLLGDGEFHSGTCPEAATIQFCSWKTPDGGVLVLFLDRNTPLGMDELPLIRVLLRLTVARGRQGQRSDKTAGAPLTFPEGMVQGRSKAWEDLTAELRVWCDAAIPLLITGETGVGKELVARTLHLSSTRAGRPFVAVNCPAIPGELLESELFGVARGAATGVEQRPGRFVEADGGALFLDEVGDLPLTLQAKLLRTLEERVVQPIGGRAKPVDVRVLSAANTDLSDAVRRGRFRADLYYRLAGGLVVVPPLRQRVEDIPLLCRHFFRKVLTEPRKRVRGLSPLALRLLCNYSWPGNVRELKNEVYRLAATAPSNGVVGVEKLSPQIAERVGGKAGPAPADSPSSLRIEPHLRRVEVSLVRTALQRAGGNKSEASRLLGVSRRGLRLKMRRLGLVR